MEQILFGLNADGYPNKQGELKSILTSFFERDIAGLVRSYDDPAGQVFAAVNRRRPEPKYFETVVESGHPYRDNEDTRHSVYFPGASEVILKFDPQCETESGCDRIYVFALNANNEEEQVGDPLSGALGNRDLVVPGERVNFRFTSDGSQTRWGYKIYCRSTRPARIESATDSAPITAAGTVELPVDEAAARTLTRTGIRLLKRQAKSDPAVMDELFDDLSELMSRSTGLKGLSPALSGAFTEVRAFLQQLLDSGSLSATHTARVVSLLLALALTAQGWTDILRLLQHPIMTSGSTQLAVVAALRGWHASTGGQEGNTWAQRTRNGTFAKVPADATSVDAATVQTWIYAIFDAKTEPFLATNTPPDRTIVNLDQSTFALLGTMINYYAAQKQTESSLYHLMVALNLFRVNASDLNGRPATAFGVTSDVSKQYMNALFDLTEIKPAQDSLVDACAAVRESALVALSSNGRLIVFPTPELETATFMALMQNDDLTPGRAAILERLTGNMMSTLPALIEGTKADATKQFLALLVDKVFDAALLHFQSLPKTLSEQTTTALEALQFPGGAVANMLNVAETLLFKAASSAGLDDVKRGVANDILTRTGVLLGDFQKGRPSDYSTAAEALRHAYVNCLSRILEKNLVADIVVQIMNDITQPQNNGVAAPIVDMITTLSKQISAFNEAFPAPPRGAIVEQMFETQHPYGNSESISMPINLVGLRSITLEFDPQSYTELNCDWFRIFCGDNCIHSQSGFWDSTWNRTITIPGGMETRAAWSSDGSNVFWGIKVKMICDGSVPQVMTTLENLIVGASSTVAQKMVAGKRLTPGDSSADLEHETTYRSTLLEGGQLEEDPSNDGRNAQEAFLKALIAGEGAGLALDAALWAKPETPQELREGPPAGISAYRQVVRGALATILHHTGRIPAAIAYATENPTATAAPLAVWSAWEAAIQVGYRYLQNNSSNLDQYVSSNGSSGADALQNSANDTLEKVNFYLKYTPAAPHAAAVAAASVIPTAGTTNSPAPAEKKGLAASRWKAAVRATKAANRWAFWKKAMTGGLRKPASGAEVKGTSMIDQIVAVLGNSTISGSRLAEMARTAAENARNRIKGFEAWTRMLDGKPTISIVFMVLSQYLLATNPRGPFSDVDGISSKLAGDLRRAYLSLYTAIAAQLDTVPTLPEKQGAQLAETVYCALGNDNIPCSEEILRTGALSEILDSINYIPFSRATTAGTCVTLSGYIVNQLSSSAVKPHVTYQLVERLFDYLATNAASARADELTMGSGRQTALALSLTLHALNNCSLAIRNHVLHTPAFTTRVQTVAHVIYTSTSTTLQVLALRLLRAMLVGSKTTEVSVRTNSATLPVLEALVELAQTHPGYATSRAVLGSGDHETPPVPTTGYATARAVTEEAVALVRSLQKTELWAPAVRAITDTTFEGVDAINAYIAEQSQADPVTPMNAELAAKYLRTIALLSILGGIENTARFGMRVRANLSTPFEGVHLSQPVGLPTVSVWRTGDNAGGIEMVEASKITLVSEVAPSPVHITAAVVRKLTAVHEAPQPKSSILRQIASDLRLRTTRVAEAAIQQNAALHEKLIAGGTIKDLVRSVAGKETFTPGQLTSTSLVRRIADSRNALLSSDVMDSGSVPRLIRPKMVSLSRAGVQFELADFGMPAVVLGAEQRVTGVLTHDGLLEKNSEGVPTVDRAVVADRIPVVDIVNEDEIAKAASMYAAAGALGVIVVMPGDYQNDEAETKVKAGVGASPIPIPTAVMNLSIANAIKPHIKMGRSFAKLLAEQPTERADNLFYVEMSGKDIATMRASYAVGEPMRRQLWEDHVKEIAAPSGNDKMLGFPEGDLQIRGGAEPSLTDMSIPGVTLTVVQDTQNHPADPVLSLLNAPVSAGAVEAIVYQPPAESRPWWESNTSSESVLTKTYVNSGEPFRFIKFHVYRCRTENPDAMQIGILDLNLADGTTISRSGFIANIVAKDSPGSPEGEQPRNALDPDTGNKYLDWGRGAKKEVELILEYPEAVKLASYRFFTANDCEGRDPVTFALEGSNDNSNWYQIDRREMVTDSIPMERHAWTPLFNISAPPTMVAQDIEKTPVISDLFEIAAEATERLETAARNTMLATLLTKWPKDVPFEAEAMGEARNVAPFIVALVKNGEPASYLDSTNPRSHPLNYTLSKLERLLRGAAGPTYLEQLLPLALAQLVEAATRDAGLVLLRDLVVPRLPQMSRDATQRVTAALCNMLWNAQDPINRTKILRIMLPVLKNLFNGEVPEGREVLEKILNQLNNGDNVPKPEKHNPISQQAFYEVCQVIAEGLKVTDKAPLEPALEMQDMIRAFNKQTIDVLSEKTFDAMFAPPTLSEFNLESPHPYENSAVYEVEVSFPGATDILLETHPECQSESNYDVLRFFDREGNQFFDFQGGFGGRTEMFSGRNYFKARFTSDGSTNYWGYKIRCQAVGMPVADQGPKLDKAAMATIFKDWTMEKDLRLVELINQAADKAHVEEPWKDVKMLEKVGPLLENSPLKGTDPATITHRIKMLQYFNAAALKVIYQLDLAAAHPLSLAGQLSALRGLLFDSLKMAYFQNTTRPSNYDSGMYDITVSRISAARALDTGDFAETLYGQIAAAIQAYLKPGAAGPSGIQTFRHPERAYKINFRGEGSIDAGGPYRESISQMCQELQSAEVGLFQLCPNGTLAVGLNRETYIPKPSYNSPEHLNWYKFVGFMIGVALRTKGAMELQLPSLVWKGLLGRQITVQDLEAIDVTTIKTLDSLRNIEAEGVTAETFGDIFFENFTTHLSDGTEVELVPGGATKPLTFENRAEYCDLTIKRQMLAYSNQLAAMREGMMQIVPTAVLDAIFSPQNLEILVAGKPTMDVGLLRTMTEYDSCTATDAHIEYLWNVLSSYTPQEQALFLRFVWGRSRLPVAASGFSRRFKIAANGRPDPDAHMPETHTCFFTIDLPRYSTEEILRTRLTYAIHNCTAIDADSEAVDRSEWK